MWLYQNDSKIGIIMNLTLVVPSKQKAETGYRGSLKKTYYGKDYEVMFMDIGVAFYIDGVFITKSEVKNKVPAKLLVALSESATNFNLI